MKRMIELDKCGECKFFKGTVYDGEGERDEYNGTCHFNNINKPISSKWTPFRDDFPDWCPLEITDDGESNFYPPTNKPQMKSEEVVVKVGGFDLNLRSDHSENSRKRYPGL